MYGALYDVVMKPLEALSLCRLRQKLISQATGRTLEVGVGTGLNLPYYPSHVFLTAIDPNKSMLKKAQKRAVHIITPTQIIDADAELLHFKNSEFDSIVSTLVGCSLPDLEAGLKEMHRVLKPGGKLLLLEHIRKNSSLVGFAQDVMTPIWKTITGGCHLNRNPLPILKKMGFSLEQEESFWNGIGKLWILRKTS